jgi:HlyD family secretion protein
VGANNKAEFRKTVTGISGISDIEVTDGISEGDQILTGSYQVIRTIKNGAIVKVDNKPKTPKPTT